MLFVCVLETLTKAAVCERIRAENARAVCCGCCFFGLYVVCERRAGVWLQEQSALAGQGQGRTRRWDVPERWHHPAGRGHNPAPGADVKG